MRVVMWSGPRNLSTAMMRSFGARRECDVVDEPFYAAFLAASGLAHPMREEVLASQPADPAEVAAACAAVGAYRLGSVEACACLWEGDQLRHALDLGIAILLCRPSTSTTPHHATPQHKSTGHDMKQPSALRTAWCTSCVGAA